MDRLPRPQQPTPAPARRLRRGRLSLSALLLAVLLPATLNAAGYDFEARAESVGTLLDAGRRLADRPAVHTALDSVAQLQREARSRRDAGQEQAARQRLDEAYALVRVVVSRLAADAAPPAATAAALEYRPAGVTGSRRYAALAASVSAFESAYREIYAERGAGRPDIGPRVHALAAAAAHDHAAGEHGAALAQITAAYSLLQAELVTLRDGQTLVHPLRFASAREEYDYEMGRHDTHLLLVELLLEQARREAETEHAVRRAVDRSMRLHWHAHQLAGNNDYRPAIARLEAANAVLAALLREYGVDIP